MDRPFLVAVDFSPYTKRNIDYAVSLASTKRNRIDLITVVKPPPIARGGPGRAIYAQALRDRLAGVKPGIEDLLLTVPEELRGECIVRDGLPADVICNVAKDGYGMVVLGTHGRSGFRHALLGSVAENVVRNCTIPTLVVR
ncbi:MAG: nucleotide-binding universal stress UspA family protein [Kiritimatiellia bacterium]|jgi:nucleotide-binding universal stress UspA family protein